MRSPLDLDRIRELWRYYQAGAINALFGFAVYALLVRFGSNIYLAQIVATIVGVAFNYITYSRHVFRDAKPAKLRFLGAYVLNYFVNLAALTFVARFIASPYFAGLIAIVFASAVNYFALKHAVFRKAVRL